MSEEAIFNSEHGLEWKKVHYGQARLESTRKSSIILAAFTFSVFSSLQLNFPSQCPWYLVTMLSVNSALLVSMNSFALIISTCILPKLQAVVEEFELPKNNSRNIKHVPEFSPHNKFNGILELSYNISHILGLFLFLLEIPLIAWVKFWDVSIDACMASTFTVIPFMIGFACFCWRYNNKLSLQAYDTRCHLIEDVEQRYRSDESTIVANSSSTPTAVVHLHPPYPILTRENSHLSVKSLSTV